MDFPKFHKEILPNGLTVICEEHPYVKSASVGLWIKTGSVFEKSLNNGVSHFIEHMVFKGTEKRNAIQIATFLESKGGDLNAFTDREYTCFHATVLNEHLELALDIISDLVFFPKFSKEEMEKERKVILRERASIHDTPEEWLSDLFMERIWKDQPHGLSIIGTDKSLKSLTHKQLLAYFNKYYVPSNMVLSIAGQFNFEEVEKAARKYFSISKQSEFKYEPVKTPKFHPFKKGFKSAQQQLHLLLGYEAVGFTSPKRFDLLILGFFLGGGMSSRLFQEVREKAGLAYHIDCDYVPFSNAGFLAMSASLDPKSLNKTMTIIQKEIDNLKNGQLNKEHLELVKGQLKGTILLGSDQMEIRQESLGRNEIVFGKYVSTEEVIAEIEKVTVDQIHKTANEIFQDKKRSLVVMSKNKADLKGF